MTDDGSSAIDVDAFLRELDEVFAAHGGPARAEEVIGRALGAARAAGDREAELTVANEAMGFFRSVGRTEEAAAQAELALDLVGALGLAGSEAHVTTLINAATAMRAAGRRDRALELYAGALELALEVLPSRDRRLAALHNNLSILHSDGDDHESAREALLAALAVLEEASPDPAADVDVASTRTNLALVCFRLGSDAEATAHAEASMAIFRRGGREDDPHYASALAGHAEASFRMGRLADAVDAYGRALAVIEACYGPGSQAYAITADNLAAAREALDAAAPTAAPAMTGLELARSYWEEVGEPALRERHGHVLARAAIGLVGHGSDRYGFDDALSRDHDFAPGFCVWLTAEDFAAHGAALQADYDALPREHHGYGRGVVTARASGEGRRVGVFEIGAFFEGLTGHREPPPADARHVWLMLDESTLAAATNGAVFRDPRGAFSSVRNGFLRMPEDVRVALVSRRIGMMAQAGQYNVPRMLARGDGEAAWLAVAEFVAAAASVVFLLNRPTSAGYLPYYKWRFAALRALAARMGARLPGVHERLAAALGVASAACLSRDDAAAGARAALSAAIEDACAQVAEELRVQGLSRSQDPFLEHHRDELRARISDPWLREQ